MTKKKPAKISYRDLLRPASQPPAAPEDAPAERPRVTPPAAASERIDEPAAEPAGPKPKRRRSKRTAAAERPVARPEVVPSEHAASAPAPHAPRPAEADLAVPRPGAPAAVASLAERLLALAAEPTGMPAAEPESEGPRLPLRERARLRAGTAQLLLFRVGTEWFATDLAAAEEAIELPQVHHVPEMPESMLGMFDLRGRMIPVYAPARVLGVPLRSTSAATLVLRGGDQRVGIAVDDVEDVLTLDLAQLRDLPGADDADGVILGVARNGRDLVAVLDADALVAACLSDRVMESL